MEKWGHNKLRFFLIRAALPLPHDRRACDRGRSRHWRRDDRLEACQALASWKHAPLWLEGGMASAAELEGGELVAGGFELAGGEAVDVLGETEPYVFHGGEAFGFLGGEVVEFGAVILHVVELPWTALGGDEFPIALAEGSVGGEVEVKGLVGFPLFAAEDGEEGTALEGVDLAGSNLFGVVGAGDIEEGGHEVDDVGGLVGEGAGLGGPGGGVRSDAACEVHTLEGFRGVDDEGGGDAAFVLILFVEAEGGVAGVGPADVVGPVRFGVPGIEFLVPGAFEGAGSVVGAEEEEGVVPLFGFLEMGDEAADVLVEDVNHSGVNLHAAGFPFFVLGGEGIPGGDVVGAGGEFPFLRKELAGALFLVALFAEDIPAGVVAALVFGDGPPGSLEGVVGGVEGEVEEEGRSRFLVIGYWVVGGGGLFRLGSRKIFGVH